VLEIWNLKHHETRIQSDWLELKHQVSIDRVVRVDMYMFSRDVYVE